MFYGSTPKPNQNRAGFVAVWCGFDSILIWHTSSPLCRIKFVQPCTDSKQTILSTNSTVNNIDQKMYFTWWVVAEYNTVLKQKQNGAIVPNHIQLSGVSTFVLHKSIYYHQIQSLHGEFYSLRPHPKSGTGTLHHSRHKVVLVKED